MVLRLTDQELKASAGIVNSGVGKPKTPEKVYVRSNRTYDSATSTSLQTVILGCSLRYVRKLRRDAK